MMYAGDALAHLDIDHMPANTAALLWIFDLGSHILTYGLA
jgi:hypothetical protein